MKKQYRKNSILILALALVMLIVSGCEADPTVSTYRRNTMQDMSAVNSQDDLPMNVYSGDVFYDQPATENENEMLHLSICGEELIPIDNITRQKIRNSIDSFVHTWYNYNFSYSTEEGIMEIHNHVTQEMAREAFSDTAINARITDIIDGEAISDITSIDYYDAYTPQLIDNNENSVIRVKVDIIARVAGNDLYFANNVHLSPGDVCYSVYFYFEKTDALRICGIYEVTYPREGACWYTGNGIDRSDTNISPLGNTSMLDQYVFEKEEVDFSLSEKNKIYASIVDFYDYFFRGYPDTAPYLAADEIFSRKYGAFIDAIMNGQIICDDNYVSYTMEMAYPDVSLYCKNGSSFYIVNESIMLDCNTDSVDTLLPFEIEDGLWKYTVHLVMSTNDPEYRVIDVEVVPYFGPYESAGDRDAG